jgi:hypothetical protein
LRQSFTNENDAFKAIFKEVYSGAPLVATNNPRFFYFQGRGSFISFEDSYMKIFADNHGGNINCLKKSMDAYVDIMKMTSPEGEAGFFMRTLDATGANYLRFWALAYGFNMNIEDVLAGESLEKLKLRNELYLRAYQKYWTIVDLRDFIAPVVYSGNCFLNLDGLDESNLDKYAENLMSLIKQAAKDDLCIDDSDMFLDRLFSAGQVVYVPDDNGETVFDMALLQNTLKYNPNLQVYVVANRVRVSNNVDLSSLQDLCRGCFPQLYANTHFLGVSTLFEVPTCADLSLGEQNIVKNSDVVFVKGQMFFENCDMYKLNPDTFYCFVSSSSINNALIGLKKGRNAGIIVRISSDQDKYVVKNGRDITRTLLDARAEANP